MQRMRELIRGSLARSLRTLAGEDRLAAALPVVCGSALAAHCEVANLDPDGTLHLRVDAPAWMPPLLGMRERLRHDLQRVAGVPVAGLHFVQAGSASDRPPRPVRHENAPAAPSGTERPARPKIYPQRPRRPA